MVSDLRANLAAKLAAKGMEHDRSKLKFFFSGKELDDSRPLAFYNVTKGSMIHVIPQGRATAPKRRVSDDQQEGIGGPATSELLFDGSDGWAVAKHLDVAAAQSWYRDQHRDLLWQGWKHDNSLAYLLNRRSGFHSEVASFLTGKMRNTALGDVSKWEPVPQCLLELDEQLRTLLIDEQFGGTPLLGSADGGSFVLGYAQFSKMPVPLREEGASRSLAPTAATARMGRGLGLHCDTPAYGDVIITVTLFGHIQIVLKNIKNIKMDHQLLGAERGGGSFDAPTQGDVNIHAGDAYGIWGKARWKMNHDAIVPPTAAAIEGLDGIARVGVTLRYFRRSFLNLRRDKCQPPPPRPLPKPFEFVDAPYYKRNPDKTWSICSAHLYTYIGVVLRVDPVARRLIIQYLSDGLGADTDWEAFAIAEVPAADVLPAVEGAKAVMRDSRPCRPWTRRSIGLVEEIRGAGVDSWLDSNFKY